MYEDESIKTRSNKKDGVIAMDTIELEESNKQKKKRIYFYAFIFLAVLNTLANLFDIGYGEASLLQVVSGLLFYSVLLFFGFRQKAWAELGIKIVVWINAVSLIIMLIFMGIALLT